MPTTGTRSRSGDRMGAFSVNQTTTIVSVNHLIPGTKTPNSSYRESDHPVTHHGLDYRTRTKTMTGTMDAAYYRLGYYSGRCPKKPRQEGL